MKHRLLLGLLSVAAVSAATLALAENWKPVPGESGTFYDEDYMRVDATSGLVLVRIAEGKPNGPYKSWPASKGPIIMFALDCLADKWIDLGMDFTGADGGLAKGWRKGEQIDDAKAAAGNAGRLACDSRESLPKAELP
jgi:hypothetical protein